MSQQAESALSKKIIDALNARGHVVWKNHGSMFSVAGLSDITGWHKDGYGIALETKMPGKHFSGLTTVQFSFLCRAAGRISTIRCGVPTSVTEAIKIAENNGLGGRIVIPSVNWVSSFLPNYESEINGLKALGVTLKVNKAST